MNGKESEVEISDSPRSHKFWWRMPRDIKKNKKRSGWYIICFFISNCNLFDQTADIIRIANLFAS